MTRCHRCTQNEATHPAGRTPDGIPRWICTDCDNDLAMTIEAVPQPFQGVGHPTTPRIVDYGHGWHNLECDRCEATWVGHKNDPCRWCAANHEATIRWQAEKVLTPDLPDPNNQHHEAAVDAWLERLTNAVLAGVVDKNTAMAAERRHRATGEAA